jgi:superfamily II DNA or RNA helicase
VPWWTASPAIVAEELIAVPDPLVTALRPGPAASARAVAASLARSLSPAEDPEPAPSWLYPEQQRSFRRALAAVRRHGGALLADPVGSGKTYVSLAVASAFNRRSTTTCLVPAALLPQWQSVAASLGVPVSLGSHEQASRGKLPDRPRGLVIIDESHRFRNRHTRRYTHVANWLIKHPALLVTATPIVNNLSDLGHQLCLTVRDSELALGGVMSLRSLLASGCVVPALGQLVIESELDTDSRPTRTFKLSLPPKDECGTIARTIEMLSRLRLSRNESIAALVRGVLLRAAGSSPAALAGTLHRYRRLLLHARDALRAGHSMDRAELRRFTDGLGDQLVWWELLPSYGTASELDLADLGELESQIQATAAATQHIDPKLGRLRDFLADDKSTLVFTGSRDTVRYIRERLGDLRLAWCTGDQAGIGSTVLPRSAVLGWFREGTPTAGAPRHLVVTEVAAEGLDLQRAARVVHYDLPWTPMRLEQREGRAIRLGSRHQEVEVVRFTPPPELERSLAIEATLACKAGLPARAGLGSSGRHIWRWRAELAGRFADTEPVAGVAAVSSDRPAILAGFAVHRANEPAVCLSASVGWLDSGGVWTESPETVTEMLLSAERGHPLPLNTECLRNWMKLLGEPIRQRLSLIQGRYWVGVEPDPAARRVANRMHRLIREAARLRQAARLLRLERALGFVAGGHTAGEGMVIERLADAGDAELEGVLSRLAPIRKEWDGLEVRLTGLIVFEETGKA